MGAVTRTLAAGAALLLIFGLGPAANAPPQKDAERGVRRALIRLNKLLAARDAGMVGEFVNASDTLLIGSEPGEVARGRAQIEAHFAKLLSGPDTITFSWREVDVSVRGTVAWLHAEGTAILRSETGERREPYRLTGVLELHGGRWLWRQFHGSQPVS
jgi:ketosteroid isomerase-like protein